MWTIVLLNTISMALKRAIGVMVGKSCDHNCLLEFVALKS